MAADAHGQSQGGIDMVKLPAKVATDTGCTSVCFTGQKSSLAAGAAHFDKLTSLQHAELVSTGG